jgi:hypothetical protein
MLKVIWHMQGVWLIYKTGYEFDDWIYCTLYIHTTWDYRQLKRYCYSHMFSSPLHTL